MFEGIFVLSGNIILNSFVMLIHVKLTKITDQIL